MQYKWYELSIADKTCKKWKNHFVNDQAAIECTIQSRGGSFGRVNVAAALCGIGISSPANNATIPSSTVDKLVGYLDNLTAAATNERGVLNHLVANNERLETTNATTLPKINTHITNAEISGGGSAVRSDPAAGGGSSTSEVSTLKRQVRKTRAAIRFKWVKGVFYSTHGWRVNEGHDSNS